MPRELDSQAASELSALASAAKAERIAIAGPLADAQRLRTESDGLQREHDALVRAIDSTIRSVDVRRSELHAAQLKAKEHTILEAALTERLGSIDREIAPFLAAADLTFEVLDADPAGVAFKLSTVAQEYDALRKQFGEFEMTLQRLAPHRAAAAASLEHARTQMTESATRLSQRRLVVEEKASIRAELLGDEATASHRTRINEARRAARQKLTRARDAEIRYRRRVPVCWRSLSGSRLWVEGREEPSHFSRIGIQYGLPGYCSVAGSDFRTDSHRPRCVQSAADTNSRD